MPDTGHMLLKFLVVLLSTLALAGADTDNKTETQYLHALYTRLHTHPELSFHEKQTSRRIALELRKAGYEVTENIGGYGVVGMLHNGPGPTVLIRTDMDALPVHEQTGLPYASTVQVVENNRTLPVMHACGHDIHMSVFVGTARDLAARKKEWSGTLMLVAQPAEEHGAGAKAMLDDGLYERFGHPDFALAEHVHPALRAGTVGLVSGYAFANVDSVDILVRGIGGHGAMPEKARDPVVLSARIVLALQTIVSRELPPLEPAVVTVGSIHGGTRRNIIPESVTLQLTVRSYSDETRRKILEAIGRIAANEARAAGMPEALLPEVKVHSAYTPAVYNDPGLYEKVRERFIERLGTENVIELKPEMIGEDFSRYGRGDPRIPSLMFRLGAANPDTLLEARKKHIDVPPLHSSRFAPLPDPTIATGVKAMSSAALLLLRPPQTR